MKINRAEILSFVIVAAAFIVGYVFYPMMPERMASHWNAAGQVNGYMSRFWGVFLMPIVTLAMFIILLLVPRIDPKKENIAKFRIHFDNFILVIFLFFFYIYGLTLWWNLGGRFDLGRYMVPAFAVLFYYAGVLISKAKMNYTIGIRTPWTLSSESVWDKTHLLGGKLFKAVGILSLFGVFFPVVAIWVVLIGVLCAALIPTVYSYVLYRREKHA
jgi:uncharacterized membrane protein